MTTTATIPADGSWDLQVVVGSAHRLGVAYSACEEDSASFETTGADQWITSADDGITWSDPESMPGCIDDPTFVWADDGRVLAMNAGGEGYVVWLRPAPSP